MRYFILFLAAYLGLFLFVEILQRYAINRIQWSRRATHIGGGIISWFLPDYLSKTEISLLASIFFIVLAFSRYRYILSLHQTERQTLGELFFPLSILALSFLCLPENPHLFKHAVILLTVSDSMAGIFGRIWSFYPIKIWGSTKSIGGSIVFLVSSFLIIAYVYDFSLDLILRMAIVSVSLTLIELGSIFGTDNITVPIFSVLLEQFLF